MVSFSLDASKALADQQTMTMMVRLFGENKTPPPLVLKATAQKLTENTYSFLNKAFPEMSADEALDMAMQRLCPESYRHCVRVGELASRFARMLGLDRKFRKDLKRSAKLKEGGFLALTLAAFDDFDQDEFMEAMLMGGEYHDIGKLAIPAEIINKPDRLTEEEYELVQLHPVIGEAMLVPLEAPELILASVRGHHERWDGEGYPDGLAGDAIPLVARMLSIVDTFDAMTGSRPYRSRVSCEEAAEEIIRHAGTQFDPELARLFCQLVLEESE
ncbi:MAG: HD domain-containing protein [Candidatus Eremiobacteraeota bacterium]|nr:HD domain-containing protein [Candidatus Eremiobacteraeota bacterium]